MKLIDILARELKEWPTDKEAVGQAQDGSLHLNYSHLEFCGHTREKYTKARDWASAHVTRVEWQAAVDALKADQADFREVCLKSPLGDCDHSYNNGHGCPECGVAFALTWKGEGRPVAGVTCDIRHECWAPDCWQTTNIKYISSEYLIVSGGYFKQEQHYHIKDIQFRPIRTAEQIAAEEQQDYWLADIAIKYDQATADKCAQILVDGGYRKQVKP